MGNYPRRPKYDEEVWVDFDEETSCWGVFGVDSGFCYSCWADEQTAEDKAAEKNEENQHKAERGNA